MNKAFGVFFNIVLVVAFLFFPLAQVQAIQAQAGKRPVLQPAESLALETQQRQDKPKGPDPKPDQFVRQNKLDKKDSHGPQRNDPAEGIPQHAYSPFDEKQNQEQSCPPGGCQTVAGQVILQFDADQTINSKSMQGGFTNNGELNKALKDAGIKELKSLFPKARRPAKGETVVSPQGEKTPKPDLTRWFVATVAEDENVWELAEMLDSVPGIAWAEPDVLRKPVGGPLEPTINLINNAELHSLPDASSDPLYAQQWHLGAAKVPEAWAYLESQGLPPGGSRDIVVAVIDTGVDYNHPDLAANIWTNQAEFNGVLGVDDDGNGYIDDIHGVDTFTHDGDPMDDNGHGTHVAGIIAAQAGNSVGGVGIAFNVQIMPIKAAQYSGVLSSTDIAEAIFYAVEKGADVINMSFGGYALSQVEEDALAVAFGQAVLVAAAGNDGRVNRPCPSGLNMFPAAYNWVLGVMASNQGGSLAGFSNFDCEPHDIQEYEVAAPGVDVWSTLPGSTYAAWDGTSMAAPIVSGIAALARTKWNDKDIYSSRFIMGQIASNGADAINSLTVPPQPEMHYLEHWLFDKTEQSLINDDDGIADAGETIDLAVVIRNHWGKADPVTVKLEARAENAVLPDPYITMINDTVSYGAIGSFNESDNGLIYDAEGVIVGVEFPFRFTISANTPNDYVIPLLLTITAGNGYDLNDPNSPYIQQSRFYLVSQRGKEIPSVISQDMVLTKENYWIMPRNTLVDAGVTLTVTEGTQIQFGAPSPSDPYGESSNPYLQIEGAFHITGTQEEPVQLFGYQFFSKPRVEIRNYGIATINYAKILNPILGYNLFNRYGYWEEYSAQLTEVNHTFFMMDRYMANNGDAWAVSSALVKNTVLHKMNGGPNPNFWLGLTSSNTQSMVLDTVLLDSPAIVYSLSQTLDEIFYISNKQSNENSFCSLSGPILNSVFLQANSYNARTILRFEVDPSISQTSFTNNAFLSKTWDPDSSNWMRLEAAQHSNREDVISLSNNYWGTTSDKLISEMIHDQNDDFSVSRLEYSPFLSTPAETTYPFVVNVVISTPSNPDTSVVSVEPVTFTVTYNRDMDQTINPLVSFGPDVPMTDYTIHPTNGGWQDARTWTGTFNVNPITGDGYQLIRVAGARAADDPWLVTGDDAGRFRFEIITSGTESMNLQATGGEGYVDLSWTQTDFDLLAGFNLYRSTSQDGQYTRINPTILPPETRSFRDPNVQPGQPYYYKFTVVKSDMAESDFSNIAQATPTDTIPPTLSHAPITAAEPGLALTLTADAADNVAVTGVTLYYRKTGTIIYNSKPMAKVSDNRYAGTIEGSFLTSPGIEYYIEATDGISVTRNGRAENPNSVIVDDRPVITATTPNKGPSTGGTAITLSGSNFKSGAVVTLGGAAASNVVVANPNQITCTTPAHFPSLVDVQVTNTDGQSGILLNGYTYESITASVSLPSTSGAAGKVVTIPVQGANVKGLVAASLTVTFDHSVLIARSARTGSLTPGWTLASNTNTPGQIRLSLVSTGGAVDGSGILANIEFEVVGAPSSSTALNISNILLNDGAILVETTPGQLRVDDVHDVAGTVRFWNGGTGIPGVSLKLSGDRIYTATSGSDGSYTIQGAASGSYALTAAKADGENGISAYDASLALQHDVGLITLSGPAATAADVNKSESISAMDAFYILQKAVNLISLPFPGAGKVWEFSPAQHSYSNLSSDQSGQDFTAILLGDISGNWTTSSPDLAAALSAPAQIRLDAGIPNAEGFVDVTVWLDPSGYQVDNLEFTLAFDPSRAEPQAVIPGAKTTHWMLAANLGQPGRLQLAMANSSPILKAGPVAVLRFRLDIPAQPVSFQPITAVLNEDASTIQMAGIGVNGNFHIFLPILNQK